MNSSGMKSIDAMFKGQRDVNVVDDKVEGESELFCPSDLEDGRNPIVDVGLSAEASNNTKPKRHPNMPIQQEVDEHSLTHCPYRSWCTICIKAQGKEDQHVSVHECREEIPRFSMDYKEMNEYIGSEKRKAITVIMREQETRMIAAFAVKAEGSIEQAKRVLEFINSFGHDVVSIKSDNEDAIKVLRDEVSMMRKSRTIFAWIGPISS